MPLERDSHPTEVWNRKYEKIVNNRMPGAADFKTVQRLNIIVGVKEELAEEVGPPRLLLIPDRKRLQAKLRAMRRNPLVTGVG